MGNFATWASMFVQPSVESFPPAYFVTFLFPYGSFRKISHTMPNTPTILILLTLTTWKHWTRCYIKCLTQFTLQKTKKCPILYFHIYSRKHVVHCREIFYVFIVPTFFSSDIQFFPTNVETYKTRKLHTYRVTFWWQTNSHNFPHQTSFSQNVTYLSFWFAL